MEIEGQSEEGFIKLKISYPHSSNLSYNFRMTITVSSHEINGHNNTLLNKTLLIPEKNVSIGPFPSGKIYKITGTSTIGGQQYNKIIFTFVSSWEKDSQSDSNIPQEESQSSLSFQQPNHNESINHSSHQVRQHAKRNDSAFSNSEDLMKMVGKSVGISNQKTLDRYILKGRNCRTTKEFVGKQNNDSLKKKEMVLKGKMILNDVYKQRQGMQFFKNDWFMGPFYSYNHNEKKLAE